MPQATEFTFIYLSIGGQIARVTHSLKRQLDTANKLINTDQERISFKIRSFQALTVLC